MGHQEDIVKTERKIIIIRDTQVILDRDVAELYGVTTKVVNQAIRNNPDKFPSGYVIELTNSEKEHVVKNFDHLETLKFSHATVKGFTEQGLYMLATILKQVLPHTPWARSFWAFSPFLNRMLKFSQLIVENSATSTASFKYFILQHQPLHSATSSALFSQRNCLFHPAKSNPSPNEVVSLTQRSRIFNPAQSYP